MRRGGSQPFRCPRGGPFPTPAQIMAFFAALAGNCWPRAFTHILAARPGARLGDQCCNSLESPCCPAQPAVNCAITMGVDEAAVKAAIKARKTYILSNLE